MGDLPPYRIQQCDALIIIRKKNGKKIGKMEEKNQSHYFGAFNANARCLRFLWHSTLRAQSSAMRLGQRFLIDVNLKYFIAL